MFLQLLLLLEYREGHYDSGSILDLEGRNLSSMHSHFFFLLSLQKVRRHFNKSQIETLFAIKGNDGRYYLFVYLNCWVYYLSKY